MSASIPNFPHLSPPLPLPLSLLLHSPRQRRLSKGWRRQRLMTTTTSAMAPESTPPGQIHVGAAVAAGDGSGRRRRSRLGTAWKAAAVAAGDGADGGSRGWLRRQRRGRRRLRPGTVRTMAIVLARDDADDSGGRGWLRCLSPSCHRRSRVASSPPSCSSRERERCGGSGSDGAHE